MLRLLHIGLGPLGKMMVLDMARRGIATVAAAVDIDPALAGKPLSQVVPECSFDTPIDTTIAAAAERSPQGFDAALLTTSSDLAKCAPSLRELCALGLPVVSTCEELLYPWLRHNALAVELDALAKRHGARLLGTGVNPGFMMDTLPVAATAVCRSVRSVKVWRIQDATTRRIPFQKKIGAGLDDAAFNARIKDGSLRHVGLGESLHFIAHYLGWKVDRWDESIEPIRATQDLSAGIGPIRKGMASGVRQIGRAWCDGSSSPTIELDFQAAVGQANPHDRTLIDAEPPLDVTIKNGVHGDVATSAISLNAIPSLMAAPAGLHTMATIPMVRFVR